MRALLCIGAILLASCGPQPEEPAPALNTPGPHAPRGETPVVEPPVPPPPSTEPPASPPPVVRPAPPPPFVPRWPALQKQVEHFEISFSQETWERIQDPRYASDYAPGRFKARGVEYEVGVRLRGDQAFFHPKKSWKVKLPEGKKLDGMRRLNFLAEWLDAGYLTDVFAYELMIAAGAHSPRARYALLTVNGKFEGIFTLVEQVDKPFLKAHGLDEDGSVYRCGTRDCELKLTPPAHYQQPWKKKTNEDEPWTDLQDFLWKVSRTPEHEFEDFLRRELELDSYLRYMAVNVLIGMSGIDDSGSYLVHDPELNKWLFVPWDLNNSVMQYWRDERVGESTRKDRPIPVFTAYDERMERTYGHKERKYGGAHMPFSVLNTRIWDRPALRNRVLDHVEELLATLFSDEEAGRRIDGQYALIRDLLPKDRYVALPQARYAPEYLKKYVTRRREWLAQNLPRERHRGEGGVVINSFGISPGETVDSKGEVAGYIELYNREDTPVDLGGLTFTDALRSPFKHRLPRGLVVPPRGMLRLYADGRVSAGPTHLPFKLRTQGGELGLYNGKNRSGVVDLTFYAPLAPGKAYGRIPDGTENWSWRTAP